MGFLDGAIVTVNVISQWINNARTKKDIQRIYRDTAKANYTSRAVFAVPHLNKSQLLLTAVDFDDISGDYMSSSSEIAAVRAYLNKLNRQAENIFVRVFTVSHNDFIASLYGGEMKGDDLFVGI